MHRRGKGCLFSLVTVLGMLMVYATVAGAQSLQQIAYWQDKYGELTASEDARVTRAHTIFSRVLRAAGTRPGVIPRLVILRRDPWGYALPMALPDGAIILSKRVLDLCYREPTRGDDRLAFILGHELDHQLRDDFWHLKFFQTFEHTSTRQPDGKTPGALEEPSSEAQLEQRRMQELQADQHGILYAAMAGFNTQAIVAEAPTVNFFDDWFRASNPHHVELSAAPRSHPTPTYRAQALTAHLRQVIEQAAVFEAGLWFYYAGDYSKAIRAFGQFLQSFPGREVSHNLAVSHHQLALQVYQLWQGKEAALPFELSIAIDPLTRASQIFLHQRLASERGRTTPTTPEVLFREHVDRAIDLYRQARTQDEAYTPAAANLASALLLRGQVTEGSSRNADWFEAVATLQRTLERTPNDPRLLNNLGVALFYVERLQDAEQHLIQARTLMPASPMPVFNLAMMAKRRGQPIKAQHYLQVYEALQADLFPTTLVGRQEMEQVAQVAIGNLEEQVPKGWGVPMRHTLHIDHIPFTLSTYPVGVSTLDREGELLLIMVREPYHGSSVRGIRIGSGVHDLRLHYGRPDRRVELTQGESWSYDTARIAFQLRHDGVVSWLLY